MTTRFPGRSQPRQINLALAIALIIYAVLLAIPQPVAVGTDLDSGWILAAERAAQNGAVFGRDFVFTYGPFAMLSTRLFRPETFGWVILTDVIVSLMWLSPLAIDRRYAVLGIYLGVILVSPFGIDARIVAGLLGWAITSMRRPGWWSVILIAAFAPLALSKLSYMLVAVPILLLVDAHRLVVSRQLPLATIAFLGVVFVAATVAGIPPELWIDASTRFGQVIGGYSSAMHLASSIGSILALVAAMVGLAIAAAWFVSTSLPRLRASNDPATTWWFVSAIVIWVGFIALKMGYVRADGHTLITWTSILLALPPLAAFLDHWSPLRRREVVVLGQLILFLVVAIVSFGLKFSVPRSTLGHVIGERLTGLIVAPIRSLAWATPRRWHEATVERARADAGIARRFPATVVGSVDAVPLNLSQVIASGLDYRPRPVPQSYSSYTPGLQRADAAFFADSARAPQTLFFQAGYDIDYRMPSLATGPSLPIIAQWYDRVGTDPLGLILRRRATPRTIVRFDHGTRDFGFGEWVPVPVTVGAERLMAAIQMDKGLSARLMGFVAREPTLSIELRRADSSIQSLRFIPSMTEMGVMLSPMMRNPTFAMNDDRATESMLYPGSQPAAAAPIKAFRIVGDPTARFGFSGGRVRLWTLVQR